MGVEVEEEQQMNNLGKSTTMSIMFAKSARISTVSVAGFRPINGLGFVLRVALVGKPALMISTGGY